LRKLLLLIAGRFKLRGSLLIIFNNDNQMMKLNGYYKNNFAPTDVLAFDLAEKRKGQYIDGEIYVNLQAARRQAQVLQLNYMEEVARLCVHGCLHLLGYDDLKVADRLKMWKVQESYIGMLEKRDINGRER
jgi:probable rRNA maturation factor